MVTEQAVDEAVNFLAESSSNYAVARARRVWLEYQLKITEAGFFKLASGNIEERKAQARTAPEYKKMVDEHQEAVVTELTLEGERHAADTRIDLFRTQEANRRVRI